MRAQDAGAAPLRGGGVTRPLPRLPALSIGCGTIALDAGRDRLRDLIAVAIAEGSCHLDTAPLYAGGESEARLGEILAEMPRDAFTLSTKTGRYPAPPGAGRGVVASRFDYSHAGTVDSVEASLSRLGLERLDIVFVHDLDERQHGADYSTRRGEALGGALPALAEMAQAGTVGAIGIASMEWRACLDLVERAPVDVVMLAGGATLLDRVSDPLFAACDARGIPVLVASPFNSGILATGAIRGARYDYRPAEQSVLDRVAAMERACARHGVHLVAAALQYPGRRNRVASLVVGHASPVEYRANLAALRTEIPQDLWLELEAL